MKLGLSLLSLFVLAFAVAAHGGTVHTSTPGRHYVVALDHHPAASLADVEKRIGSLPGTELRFVVTPALLLQPSLEAAAGSQLGELIPGPRADRFRQTARNTKSWLATTLLEDDGGRSYLTILLIDPRGEVVRKQRAVVVPPDLR